MVDLQCYVNLGLLNIELKDVSAKKETFMVPPELIIRWGGQGKHLQGRDIGAESLEMSRT